MSNVLNQFITKFDLVWIDLLSFKDLGSYVQLKRLNIN